MCAVRFTSLMTTPVIDNFHGASPGMIGDDSKIVIKCVEHLIAHVTAIWIHSNETRSPTMKKPVLQQRFLALRSLIVASGAFTSFPQKR